MQFSIIIPLKDLSYYLLFESLPTFAKQTYKNFEVLILPNSHSQYDLALLKKYRWLRIIPTGKVTKPAEKRNIGAKYATGKILGFIDDDAYPDKNWLKNARRLFNTNILAVCGPGILPPKSSTLENVFDHVLTSWIGSGGFSYRFTPQKKRFVDDYPSMNFFVHKKVFWQLGGFRGNYWPGEDSKLCEGLAYNLKGKILYDPKVITYHHRRKNLSGYIKQHANYGFHRGAFFAHGDKNSRKISYLLPTIFVFYLIFLLLIINYSFLIKLSFKPFFVYFTIPALFYLAIMLHLLISAIFVKKNVAVAILSPITLFTTHIVYGIMFVKGFWKGIRKKNKIYE